jgi:hypothetical protein
VIRSFSILARWIEQEVLMRSSYVSWRAFFTGCALLGAVCVLGSQTAAAEPLYAQNGAYELQVRVDGQPAPTFSHAGESYVLGELRARYTLRVINHSARRIEAVVSVDGLDVIDGKPAASGKRGYLVPAWGYVDIDGWRLSGERAAAFRFAAVADSYAARTSGARNVGVIGAAIFPERAPPVRAVPQLARPVPMAEPVPPSARYERSDGLRSPAASAMGAPKSAESSLSADAAAPAQRRESRSGLGTEFGETVSSRITEVEFVRASPRAPAHVLGLRYDDRSGLLAMGVPLCQRGDGSCDEARLRKSATPFPLARRTDYAVPPPHWSCGN